MKSGIGKNNSLNTFSIDPYGDIQINTAVFDLDGTTMVNGIEIKLIDEDAIIEIYEEIIIDNLEVDDVEKLIEENYHLKK